MISIRSTTLAAVLLLATLAPSVAEAERVVTRKGRIIEGTVRFEGETVVVKRADGTEVRLPRSEVERIELSPGQQPPVAKPRGQTPPAPRRNGGAPPPQAQPQRPPPPPSPAYPRYVPPPAPPPGDLTVGRQMGEHRGFRSGAALALGYHRGLALGGEWQQRLDRYVGLGLGAQVGLAANEDVSCVTWGGTARLYVGNEHRFVAEGGFGLNKIDPYLNLRPGDNPTCGDAEKNYGPEASAGYQFVSKQGFLFETLAGAIFITNDELNDAHDPVAFGFQLSFGYVFR